MVDEKGLIIAFTGDGKGKTTAALGIALRAVGRGQRTAIFQFMKGLERSGEQMLDRAAIPLILVHSFGAGFLRPGDDPAPHLKAAEQGWQAARKELRSGGADIVILDEISHAINHGLLSLESVIQAIIGRRYGLHVVLTGRNMPPDLIDTADIVTEMKEIRHAYHTGRHPVIGIDY
ncbi:MAG: cob(I)yrinic acid a,c-diamide adenosyltransferase [Syntrophorhabdaceae bacterium]|nr:cob(I)yrinic acid a,c-diamide adenosyltransferase [Syntrophorhabdaceae bacterium]